MNSTYNLKRFIDAQNADYERALSEIKAGRKRTHWMWYIFPQVKGLGFSNISQLYAIQDIQEAEAFLQHEVLGSRLVNISAELLQLANNNATQVMGSPDDLKLKSCMTLFASVPTTDEVFEKVLQKFFGGSKDSRTIDIIKRGNRN